jgi:restriction system protein
MVERLLEEKKVVEFFDPTPPYAGEELFSAQSLLVSKGGIQIRFDVEEINEELIRYLALHPEKMRDLPSRKFEELVAELFKDKGYDVELTPKTKDGGFDIRAFNRSDTGRLLTLVECKRYSEQNKVEVAIVRALHGVVQSEKASCGIIATTSTFTRGAKAFREKHEYQMHLADFSILENWLRSFKTKP